ncbi:MAG: 4a-hydroxytetrahydrobiopterin dehydratase [Chloroflexota bacterium]|jgi:4a-hydroxytetrahydrobiopterin dehydratase|nr:4a-hydroxytetrahydrobiopterin dehydratase [Chloroflexota bacterium]
MPDADRTPLDQQHCVACKPGSPHLAREEIDKLLGEVDGWAVEEADGHLRLAKVFKFKGFMPAVELVNRIAPVAEAEKHHPDLLVSYGSVTVWLWTHAAGGITQNDFILAAKIDRL